MLVFERFARLYLPLTYAFDNTLLMTICADGDVVAMEQPAKRFMRFGRQQQQQQASDGVSQMVKPSVPVKREFMRFGRDVRRQNSGRSSLYR